MKLISRKAAIAAITAAAVTAGTMTAPAMAVEKPANTVSAGQQDGNTSKKDDNAGKKDGSSDKASGSSDKVAGSSEWLFKKNDDQKTGLDSLKDWLTLLTTIGSLLGALYTICNNLDRLNRNR